MESKDLSQWARVCSQQPITDQRQSLTTGQTYSRWWDPRVSGARVGGTEGMGWYPCSVLDITHPLSCHLSAYARRAKVGHVGPQFIICLSENAGGDSSTNLANTLVGRHLNPITPLK